jgi:hypothetical protein
VIYNATFNPDTVHARHLSIQSIMDSFMSKFLLVFVLFYAPSLAAKTLVEAGLHYGGDELVVNDPRYSGRAGNMFSFALGGMKSYSPHIEGQFSIGTKSDIIHSRDPEITWSRIPLNTMLFYRYKRFRLGLGLTVHFSPKLKGSGTASNVTTDFKHAIGGLFEVDFDINETFLWGIRYTRINYHTQSDNRRVNGDSVGLLIIALL